MYVIQHDGVGFAMRPQGDDVLRITANIEDAWHTADAAAARRLAEAWNKREGHRRWRAVPETTAIHERAIAQLELRIVQGEMDDA